MAEKLAKKIGRLLILLLSLSHLAATCQGTETGNPQFNPGEEAECLVAKSQVGSDETLDDLILAVCQRVAVCGVPSIDVCVDALNGEDGDLMTDELGQIEGATIDQLREGLLAGTIESVDSAAAVCEEEIGEVACSEVTANIFAGDFSGVENLIPSSCIQAFEAVSGEAPSSGCP